MLRGSRVGQLALFLLPAAAFFSFVVLVPSGQGAAYAVTDWDGLSPTKNFVGLDQFLAIRDDDAAADAIRNTLILAVTITIGQNVVGLLLALGVHSQIKLRNVMRVLLFAPIVVLPVAAAYLWQYLLSPDGAINYTLRTIGLAGLAQNWLGDPSLVLWSVSAAIIWQYAGFTMVIFLAGLVTVPADIIEAARVDGAGYLRRFWSIVLPHLGPAITVNVLLTTISGLKLFDQVFVMTHGGPGHASETISTVIYKEAFLNGRFAYGTAMALVLAVFVAIVSFGQYYALTRRNRTA